MAIADYFMCVLVLLGIADTISEYQLCSGTYRYNTEKSFDLRFMISPCGLALPRDVVGSKGGVGVGSKVGGTARVGGHGGRASKRVGSFLQIILILYR